jgi:hypothetical protein
VEDGTNALYLEPCARTSVLTRILAGLSEHAGRVLSSDRMSDLRESNIAGRQRLNPVQGSSGPVIDITSGVMICINLI